MPRWLEVEDSLGLASTGLHWPLAKITGPAAGQQGIAPVLTEGPVSFGAFFFCRFRTRIAGSRTFSLFQSRYYCIRSTKIDCFDMTELECYAFTVTYCVLHMLFESYYDVYT